MKNPSKDAAVLMAKCGRSKQPYGVTIEKDAQGVWHCVWAFRISEKAASSEGYDETKVTGQIVVDAEYPGCPYCGARGWFSCTCGKLTCLKEGESRVTCAWCGSSGELQSTESFDLQGGGY